jgi:hypothetical protein
MIVMSPLAFVLNRGVNARSARAEEQIASVKSAPTAVILRTRAKPNLSGTGLPSPVRRQPAIAILRLR